MQLGLREANQRFSYAIKRVKAGETVILTERGRPVAMITPIRAPAADEETAMQRLADAGLIIRATKRGPMRKWTPIRIKGEPISETISRERDER
ncbi:MAG TPA: type II toxin-antitoxin system prevent-host-death family antitoxin [bacterium]|nr:type II toxin-antitoxin system prevent-host-death family antitoxin [bacterium]